MKRKKKHTSFEWDIFWESLRLFLKATLGSWKNSAENPEIYSWPHIAWASPFVNSPFQSCLSSCILFCLGATPSGAHRHILVLYLGVVPSGVQDLVWGCAHSLEPTHILLWPSVCRLWLTHAIIHFVFIALSVINWLFVWGTSVSHMMVLGLIPGSVLRVVLGSIHGTMWCWCQASNRTYLLFAFSHWVLSPALSIMF